MASDRRIVYDSDLGRIDHCPRCGRRGDRCRCDAPARPANRVPQRPPNDGVVRIMRDRRHRGGKTVTVIIGLPGHPAALAALAADLKRLCGSGGTVRDGVVEIQGDHRERIAALLSERGHRVKLAGG